MDATLVALLTLAGLAVVLPGSILVLSWLAGPRRSGRVTDMTPYECGSKPFVSARRRFPVKFYLVAMLFLVFDVEAVFLFPWAVELRHAVERASGRFVFWEMIAFLGILVVGFVYAWGRGALEWDR
jgi:NADH-quinone oxidoreductase subunit A